MTYKEAVQCVMFASYAIQKWIVCGAATVAVACILVVR